MLSKPLLAFVLLAASVVAKADTAKLARIIPRLLL
jgi:hypothetical protein